MKKNFSVRSELTVDGLLVGRRHIRGGEETRTKVNWEGVGAE